MPGSNSTRTMVDPAAPEFVEGWSMVQTLGEGAFGEVKLLINRESGEAVALKMVDLHKHPEAETSVRKEMLIHKMLKHPNIIKFFGSRREGLMQYMFLEYAVGGELFDRIEPDVGMPSDQARRYFTELINGVHYLHSRGVAHRDIKPENLLLDVNDTIKITDFGLATIFRHSKRERMLDKKCGTRPYMAPELLAEKEYLAQPADLWSCGIVLVAMLAGELPWDEPSSKCHEYLIWKRREASYLGTSPWTKVSTCVLSLLRRLLQPTSAQRFTVTQIREHSWIAKHVTTPDIRHKSNGKTAPLTVSPESGPASKRICSELDNSFPVCVERMACSQPQPSVKAAFSQHLTAADDLDTDTLCFSQPAKPDHLLLASSPTTTNHDNSSATPLQRLVRRMTRVLVNCSLQDTIKHLDELFDTLHYRTAAHTPNILTVSTVDRRGAPLVMKASVLNMGAHILVDFRLSKGCGLDFKREFVRIKEGLAHIIVTGPVTWSLANATNTLPA
uniref:non-specific serine/threonine protein kinase n=1 Tax=Hirondellea gigas TaxID=1518452 RepID=A0A2P2HZS5_9CRUS